MIWWRPCRDLWCFGCRAVRFCWDFVSAFSAWNVSNNQKLKSGCSLKKSSPMSATAKILSLPLLRVLRGGVLPPKWLKARPVAQSLSPKASSSAQS